MITEVLSFFEYRLQFLSLVFYSYHGMVFHLLSESYSCMVFFFEAIVNGIFF
jgi:hypothetical protein